MGGSVVCVTPEWRAARAEQAEAAVRESWRGSTVLCVPSLHWATYGRPELDRAAAALRVRQASDDGAWLRDPDQPPQVVEQRVELDRLPGSGLKLATTAAELGFEVECVHGSGVVGRSVELRDSYSLRARWPNGPSGRLPLVVGLWINGQANGAWVRTERALVKFGVSTIDEVLRTIAAGHK